MMESTKESLNLSQGQVEWGGDQRQYWVLVGTRPEVIKQVPLYLELVKRYGKNKVALVGTGQHRELLDQALAHFGVQLDINLNIMKPGQSLIDSSTAILQGIQSLFGSHKPEWLIVQGDTTSAAMAAWAAYLSGVKVAHNEAGLRSYNLQHPFPEEANRRLIGIVADAHFAPTETARAALLKEGTNPHQVFVTGNTGIDALRLTIEQNCPPNVSHLLEELRADGLRPVLLTAHRRENREHMDEWFQTLDRFLSLHPDLAIVYPIHPNNAARSAAEKYLSNRKQVRMIAPLSYAETGHLLSNCDFVVTDSGGIQEEATTLGLPVVVCRKTTERMEAVHAGLARLAGTNPAKVMETMEWAVSLGRPVKKGLNFDIFGDGFASQKIADLLESLDRHPVPEKMQPWMPGIPFTQIYKSDEEFVPSQASQED